jgi:hypothetical protein
VHPGHLVVEQQQQQQVLGEQAAGFQATPGACDLLCTSTGAAAAAAGIRCAALCPQRCSNVHPDHWPYGSSCMALCTG